jgi:predicted NBD/HSP70 family sugar kinase
MGHLWGIDLGGTKVEGAILDTESLEVVARTRIPTEQQHGYRHIIGQITKLVSMLKAETGLSPEVIGIGTPGSTDPKTGTLKNSNTVCLNGEPLHEDLQKALNLPVKMANDANCFALAETRMGVVPEVCPDARLVFGVIMGTGVGGGIVIHNQVWNGRMGIGGEWGHTFMDESGGPCYCGDIGCTEQVISGPALERFYHGISGNKLKMKDIVVKYRDRSDDHAIKTMERLMHFFGRGLSNVINVLDPDVVVLGGGVGNIDELYTSGLESLEKHIFNTRFETIVARPKLGDSAGVFGAAFLAE